MTKKNILHIIHSLDIGGAEKLVFDMAAETRKDIFNVMICCLDNIGVLGEQLALKGYNVACLGRRPGVDWGLIFRLRDYFVKKRIDIVHAHQYTSFFYASLAKNFKKKPYIIFTEHGRFYPDRRSIRRYIFDPFLSRFASEIVSISEATKKAMIKYDNFPGGRIRVVYNGTKFMNGSVDKIQKRKDINISSSDFVIATAARLDPIKNISMMIRAMKKVVKIVSDCKLIIMGDGVEYQKLSSEIGDNGLSNYVYLLGYRNDVNEIFLASDLFLLSSFTEGTSVTLLEAMNAGLPAVVTNVGGNPEILKNGETGFLVESDDALGMAEKILFFYRNRDIAINFGKAGQKRVRERFSFDRMIKEYEELYIRCVE